ncbi:SixA phosphatase family protein [Parahaliea mediterranea]|uniref:SixA phosphatase family protein n=1 Tax=Parahaliea mediterranea TaxID=651086 RepID=UPI000E2F626F|nr:histidine phosphatase family protein [Parahaliea mediterranea]
MRLAALLLLLGLAPLGALAEPSPAPCATTGLSVMLVRHAEKQPTGEDPALSPAGEARARALATTLGDACIAHIHSSDYRRTRDTAAPLAKALGRKVAIYDVDDLPALKAALIATGGRHLVVGHSDTTPELVRLLGGDAGSAIDEATEYDRLYMVTVDERGVVTTTLLRYGAASASRSGVSPPSSASPASG